MTKEDAPALLGHDPASIVPAALSPERAQALAADADAAVDESATTLDGKHEVARIAALVPSAGGHLLIEASPGVGKPTLASSLAAALGASKHRIQFAPDLLPGDVTGASIFDQSTSRFEFRKGAVFTQILLADEINRASPKTQSALLEAMEERQVSVEIGRAHV